MAKFEGRGWRGFNHHVTVCLAASSCPSEAFSPLGSPPKQTRTARHNPYSIASLRHRIARMIMHKLDRCPYCAQSYIACQKPNDNTLHKML